MLIKRIESGQNFLWKILLSATLFNLAFLWSNSFGFCIILAFLLLFFIQANLIFERSFLKNFCSGFFFGLLIFSAHFIWFYELLLTKSQASFLLATNIYLFAILYFSVFSGIWFLLTKVIYQLVKNILFSIISSVIIFFLFIQKYSLFILGRVEGYPFLNPLIPLAKYKWFIFIYSLFFNPVPMPKLESTKIFYLKPVVRSFDKREEDLSSITVAQKIYQQLIKLELHKFASKYETLIIVSPETSYPFSLNKNMESLKLWDFALPSNAYLFLGSQRSEERIKLFQSIFCLKKRRIMQYYDKTHQVLFTEKIPQKWKKISWAKTLFLKDTEEFHKGKNMDFRFTLPGGLNIKPAICSEFFFKDFNAPKDGILFLFANDSWFMNYFKKIMENFVRLKQIQLGIPILYITHEKAINMGFSLN